MNEVVVEDKEGKKQSKLRVVVESFQFVDSREGGGGGGGGSSDVFSLFSLLLLLLPRFKRHYTNYRRNNT